MPRQIASRTDSLTEVRRAALYYSISRAPIFAGLPEEDLQRLSRYAIVRSLPRGRYLFRQGDSVLGFFVVRLGLINVHRLSAEGREQIVHLLRPGESFAERAVISETGYPANARAVQDSEVILIPIDDFRRHQKDRPDLAWRMLASMSHHLRSLVATLEGLRITDVETRLIHWLLQHCASSESLTPVEIDLGMSKTDLARELATRRETLSRTLQRLKSRGLLTVKTRTVVVNNPSELQSIYNERQTVSNTSQIAG